MIERKTATGLMKQFVGMSMMPTEKEQTDIRCEALQRGARSDSHAMAIVKHLTGTLSFYPTVADITQASEYIMDPASAEAKKIAKQCQYCGGDGWYSVPGPYGTSAAIRCDHSGRERNEGVVMSPAVENMYRMEEQAIPERIAAFNAMAEKPKSGFRKATVPQAILDAIR